MAENYSISAGTNIGLLCGSAAFGYFMGGYIRDFNEPHEVAGDGKYEPCPRSSCCMCWPSIWGQRVPTILAGCFVGGLLASVGTSKLIGMSVRFGKYLDWRVFHMVGRICIRVYGATPRGALMFSMLSAMLAGGFAGYRGNSISFAQ